MSSLYQGFNGQDLKVSTGVSLVPPYIADGLQQGFFGLPCKPFWFQPQHPGSPHVSPSPPVYLNQRISMCGGGHKSESTIFFVPAFPPMYLVKHPDLECDERAQPGYSLF